VAWKGAVKALGSMVMLGGDELNKVSVVMSEAVYSELTMVLFVVM
jgi:hypothetical protein